MKLSLYILLAVTIAGFAYATDQSPSRTNDDALRTQIAGTWILKKRFGISSAVDCMQINPDGSMGVIIKVSILGIGTGSVYQEYRWKIENGVLSATLLRTSEPEFGSKVMVPNKNIVRLDREKLAFATADVKTRPEWMRIPAMPEELKRLIQKLKKDLVPPNKTPEPTTGSVTSQTEARPAPVAVMAHL